MRGGGRRSGEAAGRGGQPKSVALFGLPSRKKTFAERPSSTSRRYDAAEQSAPARERAASQPRPARRAGSAPAGRTAVGWGAAPRPGTSGQSLQVSGPGFRAVQSHLQQFSAVWNGLGWFAGGLSCSNLLQQSAGLYGGGQALEKRARVRVQSAAAAREALSVRRGARARVTIDRRRRLSLSIGHALM